MNRGVSAGGPGQALNHDRQGSLGWRLNRLEGFRSTKTNGHSVEVIHTPLRTKTTRKRKAAPEYKVFGVGRRVCKRTAEFPSLEFSPGNIAETPRAPDPGPQKVSVPASPQTEWQSAREAGRATRPLGPQASEGPSGLRDKPGHGHRSGERESCARTGRLAPLPVWGTKPLHIPPAVHEAPFPPQPCQPLLRRALPTGLSRARRRADLHFPDDDGRAASFQRTRWPLVGLL